MIPHLIGFRQAKLYGESIRGNQKAIKKLMAHHQSLKKSWYAIVSKPRLLNDTDRAIAHHLFEQGELVSESLNVATSTKE